MSLRKLEKHKTVRLNGVRFTIRKLGQQVFLDKDYTFPMTSAVEKAKSEARELSEKEMFKVTDDFKEKMEDVITRGVVDVRSGWFRKRAPIGSVLGALMENPELYSLLFSLIVNHSLGIKKKLLNRLK